MGWEGMGKLLMEIFLSKKKTKIKERDEWL